VTYKYSHSFGIKFSLFYLIKLILLILNERLKFKVGVSNDVYKVNIGTSFKNLNNVKSYTPLNALTLNSDHKIYNFHFIK
jgi:hypothetical protein